MSLGCPVVAFCIRLRPVPGQHLIEERELLPRSAPALRLAVPWPLEVCVGPHGRGEGCVSQVTAWLGLHVIEGFQHHVEVAPLLMRSHNGDVRGGCGQQLLLQHLSEKGKASLAFRCTAGSNRTAVGRSTPNEPMLLDSSDLRPSRSEP